MKIKDIIRTIDKSDPEWVNLDDIGRELGVSDSYMGDYEKFAKRVKSYWFVSWYCTDQWVGGKVYFMDDMAVAVSMQTARKNDEHFEWVSIDYAKMVRDFVLECCEDDFNPAIVDMNEDIDIDLIKIERGVA